MSAPPHDFSLQILVRKSAHSRAQNQTPLPPTLLCSWCPVPAAATPPLNPAHPAPFSAKPFHQVGLPSLRSPALHRFALRQFSLLFCALSGFSADAERTCGASFCVVNTCDTGAFTWSRFDFNFRSWNLESLKCLFVFLFSVSGGWCVPAWGCLWRESWHFNHQTNWQKLEVN